TPTTKHFYLIANINNKILPLVTNTNPTLMMKSTTSNSNINSKIPI
ncbi:10564_t:CDS:1, partial [Gigaspora margarita]